MLRLHTSVLFAILFSMTAIPASAQCNPSTINAGYTWISVPENPPPPLYQFQGGVMNIGIWYPTSSTPSSYTYNAEGTGPLVLSGCAAFKGAVAKGKYPVLLFSHGDGGCGTQSVFFTEQAAREGYIVIAPDSTDAECSVTGVPYTDPSPSPSYTDPSSWTPQTEINRLYDIENALLAVYSNPTYGPYMDLTHIAMSGHSLGGYTTFGIVGGWSSWQSQWQTTMSNAGVSQAIVKVALMFSPFIQAYTDQTPSTVPQVTVPMMFEGGTEDIQITPWVMGVFPDIVDIGAFAEAHTPKMFMELYMGGHLSFTNIVCSNLPVETCLTSVPNAELIDNYGFAFLANYLNNQSAPLLWSKPSPFTDQGPANWWRITPATSVNDASYSATAPLAPSEVAAMFGAGLASTTASSGTAPTSLASIQVSMTDSSNVTRQAPLYYVSQDQVTYVVPSSTAVGAASVSVSDSSGAVTNSADAAYPGNPVIQGDIVASGTAQIAAVAPALFTEGGSVAAAYLFTLQSGSTSYVDVFQCTSSSTCSTVPLALGVPGDTVWLELYGTGIRNASSVSVTIGGQTLAPLYAGASSYTGLDQVDVEIPQSFAGRGTVAVTVSTPGGVESNPVMVTFQ